MLILYIIYFQYKTRSHTNSTFKQLPYSRSLPAVAHKFSQSARLLTAFFHNSGPFPHLNRVERKRTPSGHKRIFVFPLEAFIAVVVCISGIVRYKRRIALPQQPNGINFYPTSCGENYISLCKPAIAFHLGSRHKSAL